MVSIGIAVKNSASTIRAALRSVLDQTFDDFEVVLVDDGSIDDTAAVAQALGDSRVRIHRHAESRGQSFRLNEAIDLARGRFFARMDGDDLCFPRRLEKQLDYLLAHPEVDLLGTFALLCTPQGEALGRLASHEQHEMLVADVSGAIPIPHPTFFGATAWFQRVRYDTGFDFRANDQEMLYREIPASRYACVPETLFAYMRDHGSPSAMGKELREQRDMLLILARFAWRNRKLARLPFWALKRLARGSASLALIATRRHHLARRRFLVPLSPDERLAWHSVWAKYGPDYRSRA